MGGLIADARQKEGYELERRLQSALPMAVWGVDLEVERHREVSAAESAVLGIVDAGTSDIPGLAQLLGMGADGRLAEQVLVRLLGAGAIEAKGEIFILTEHGQAWKSVGTALMRERVSLEIRLNPATEALEWVDHERPVFADPDMWTIELDAVGDEELLDRRAELGELIQDGGLPDEEDRAPHEQRPPVELRGFAITSRRRHWRRVRLDHWVHPTRSDSQLIGYIADAENPPLTELLAGHSLVLERLRVAATGS